MDAKDIEKIMKLCRKYGVTSFQSEALTMSFGELPRDKDTGPDEEVSSPDELTPEQLMYFSVGGVSPP